MCFVFSRLASVQFCRLLKCYLWKSSLQGTFDWSVEDSEIIDSFFTSKNISDLILTRLLVMLTMAGHVCRWTGSKGHISTFMCYIIFTVQDGRDGEMHSKKFRQDFRACNACHGTRRIRLLCNSGLHLTLLISTSMSMLNVTFHGRYSHNCYCEICDQSSDFKPQWNAAPYTQIIDSTDFIGCDTYVWVSVWDRVNQSGVSSG